MASCLVPGCESTPVTPAAEWAAPRPDLSPRQPSPAPWDLGPALNTDSHQCHSGKLKWLTDGEQRELKQMCKELLIADNWVRVAGERAVSK